MLRHHTCETTVGRRSGVLLLEWRSFRALLLVGMRFKEMEALKTGEEVGPVTALLLAAFGYAQLNPAEWVEVENP